MKLVELSFNWQITEHGVFNVLSDEFEIEPKITSLDALENFIRSNGEFQVEIKYADEPTGRAGELVQEMLRLFDRLKTELGEDHFTYRLLPREQVTIDLTWQKYVGYLWEELADKMDTQDYGKNYDALWDILTGCPHKGDDFTILRRRRYGNEVNYGKPEGFTQSVDKICSIFQRAQEQGYLTVKIVYTDDRPADLSDYLV